MNKNNLNKVKFFLTGIQSRIIEKKDFFIDMRMIFNTGSKEFASRVSFLNDKLSFNLLGRKYSCSVNEFSVILSDCLTGYDGFTLKYFERGRIYILTADDKNVKLNTEDNVTDKVQEHEYNMQEREYYIKPGQADNLLKALGILSETGKIKNDMARKYNQLDYFVELIYKNFSDEIAAQDDFKFIDCACGKSYLTFALNYYLTDILKKPCYAIGLDYSDVVIDASLKTADELQYRNMEFIKTDISKYKSTTTMNLLISLHACDTATDYAIAYGINNNIPGIIVVPCCHKQLLDQISFKPLNPLFEHGILKARMTDVLTDGLRALLLQAVGYKVSVFEYISPLETPKNIMMLAKKQKKPNEKAYMEYLEIKKLLSVEPILEKLIMKL